MDIAFNPNERPERQYDLNKIPAASTVSHPGIREAIESYEAARADELARRRDAIDAEQKLPEAEQLDAVALADAQAANRKDPGAKHRQQALDAIAETRRRHSAAKVTLGRAVSNVGHALDEFGGEWRAALEIERDELRATAGARWTNSSGSTRDFNSTPAPATSLAAARRRTRPVSPTASKPRECLTATLSTWPMC